MLYRYMSVCIAAVRRCTFSYRNHVESINFITTYFRCMWLKLKINWGKTNKQKHMRTDVLLCWTGRCRWYYEEFNWSNQQLIMNEIRVLYWEQNKNSSAFKMWKVRCDSIQLSASLTFWRFVYMKLSKEIVEFFLSLFMGISQWKMYFTILC